MNYNLCKETAPSFSDSFFVLNYSEKLRKFKKTFKKYRKRQEIEHNRLKFT